MTDLEKHVNRPGRDKQVKKVREKIDELGTVSYTHLRAHETGAYLVCRLLLEKI